jgi:hypothetical protein
MVESIISEDYATAELLDPAGQNLSDYRLAHSPNLRQDMAREDREWDRVYSQFLESQSARSREMLDRHRAERRSCRAGEVGSLELNRMRKQGKELALAKRFQEAQEVKDRADQLQQKLSVLSLLALQRDEREFFEEHFQIGIEFIEKERQRTKEKFMSVIDRMRGGKGKRSVLKVRRRPAGSGQRPLLPTTEVPTPPRGRWI